MPLCDVTLRRSNVHPLPPAHRSFDNHDLKYSRKTFMVYPTAIATCAKDQPWSALDCVDHYFKLASHATWSFVWRHCCHIRTGIGAVKIEMTTFCNECMKCVHVKLSVREIMSSLVLYCFRLTGSRNLLPSKIDVSYHFQGLIYCETVLNPAKDSFILKLYISVSFPLALFRFGLCVTTGSSTSISETCQWVFRVGPYISDYQNAKWDNRTQWFGHWYQ